MKVLAMAGSLREQSYNRGLVRAAQALAPSGMTLTIGDIAPLPLYNGDDDGDNRPAAVMALAEQVAQADASLFATPEYNYSIPGVLKNAIDWLSRVPGDIFTGKPAAIMGASMGGMVAQLAAATHPERVLSVTSIMSSTNSPFLPPPKPAALKTLVAPKVKIETVEDYVAFGLGMMAKLGGTLDQGRDELTEMFQRSWERGLNPRGVRNQFMAIMATGNLSKRLKNVRCPAQVIHGGADPLIRPAGGRASARAMPGARLTIIDGMGHDFPPSVQPRLIELVAENCARAGRAPKAAA